MAFQYALSEQAATSPLVPDSLLVATFLYYTLAGYTALQLLRGTPSANKWAIAALIPQLVQIQNQTVAYKIVCGLQATITIGNGVNLGFGALADVWFRVGDLSLPGRFAINLVPAAFLWYLYHRREEAA